MKLKGYSRLFVNSSVIPTVIIVAMAAGPAAQAAAPDWNTAVDGNWTDGTKWSTGFAPIAGDTVTFNAAAQNGPETIYLNGDQAAATLTFANTGTTTLLGGLSGFPATNLLTLSGATTASVGAGAVTIGSPTALVNIALGASAGFTNNSANLLSLAGGVSSATAGAKILTVAGTGNTTMAGDLINGAGTLGLTKSGAGTLSLSGAASDLGGAVFFNGGKISLNGSLTSSGTVGILNSAVYQSGGNFSTNFTPGTSAQALVIGGNINSAGGGYGYYNLSTGSFGTTTGTAQVQVGGNGSQTSGANGVLDMSDGTAASAGSTQIGRGTNALGLLNVTGGTYTAGTFLQLAQNGAAGAATLNVGGGVVAAAVTANSTAANGLDMSNQAGTATSNGSVNLLTNGTLAVSQVSGQNANPNTYFNFNGGTLKALGGTAQGNNFLTSANVDRVTVYSNGGTIDNNGQNITASKVLAGATGSGLRTTVTISNGGSGYVGAPAVTITDVGGSGIGATGYAVIDPSTRVVTDVVITSPGTGFTGTPTIVFSGGMGTGAAATASLVANTSGGMTFTGSATTSLSSVSTYAGPTSVTDGNLLLSGAGSINSSSGITVNGSAARLVQTSSVAITPPISLTEGTLDGTGTVGAVTVGNSTGGVVANGNGTSATLTVGSLSFGGAGTVNIVDSAATPTARIVVAGALNTTPANGKVTINGSGLWSNGVNNLISYGSLGGSLTSFELGSIDGLTSRQSLGTLSLVGNNLALTINGDSPKWTGRDSTEWVVGTTGANSNWKLITGGANTDYIEGDVVLFDDSATTAITPGTVSLSTADVFPSSTTFNNSTINYVVGGGFGIGGNGPLVKSGTATTTLSTPNYYTGATSINSGTLNLQNSSALGASVSATVASGAALELQGNVSIGSTPLTLNGAGLTASPAGALRNVSDTNSYAGPISLGSNATIQSDADTLTLTGTIAGAGNILTVTGAGSTAISGVIGIGSSSLVKNGAGSLRLAGANTYTGGTTLNAGTLTLASATALGGAAGPVNINGGTITANGATVVNLTNANSWNIGGDLTVGDAANPIRLLLGASNTLDVLNGTRTVTLFQGSAEVTSANAQFGIGSGGTTTNAINSTGGAGVLRFVGGANASAAAPGIVRIDGALTFANGVDFTIGANATTIIQSGATFAGDPTVTVEANGALNLSDQSSTPNSRNLTIGALSGAGMVVNSAQAAGTATLTLGGANSGNFSGIIQDGGYNGTTSGIVAITVSKLAGIQTLSGANTYTGATTVTGGTLSITNPVLADTAAVIIGTGGVLNLPHGATDQVGSLSVGGGAPLPDGIYDKDTPATSGFITGTGKIQVSSGAGYDSWAATFPFTVGVNDGPEQDADFDGIENLLEYVFGGIPVGPGSNDVSIILPLQTVTANDLKLSFRRSDLSEADTVLKVQWSANLTTWNDFATIGADDALPAVDVTEDSPTAELDTVEAFIPRTNAVGGKLFGRVVATKP